MNFFGGTIIATECSLAVAEAGCGEHSELPEWWHSIVWDAGHIVLQTQGMLYSGLRDVVFWTQEVLYFRQRGCCILDLGDVVFWTQMLCSGLITPTPRC